MAPGASLLPAGSSSQEGAPLTTSVGTDPSTPSSPSLWSSRPSPHSWRHGVQASRRWQGQGCGYLGLSRMSLSNWETSQSAPGQGELVKCEAALGILG